MKSIIERSSSLEEQIRDELLKRIQGSQPEYRKRLPSETDIAKEFNVSRATVRAALSLLAIQGIVFRVHGSGTYVNQEMLHIRNRVSEQWEFVDLIRLSGFIPGIKFKDSRVTKPNEETATALGIDIEDEILEIKKVFTASGKSAIYSINMLSVKMVPAPYDEEKLHGPIFPFLKEDYGLTPTFSVADIYALNASREISALLDVPFQHAILLLKDLFYGSDSYPIMYAHNYYNDILHFKSIRNPSANLV